MNITSEAVLGFPYDNGMHYMFSRLNPHGPISETGNLYYEALYTLSPMEQQIRAANIGALFDTILLAPADEYLPDRKSYEKDGVYYHSDLRVKMPVKLWPHGDDLDKLIDQMEVDPVALNLIEQGSLPITQAHLHAVVRRIVAQLILASSHRATIVFGDAGMVLANRILEILQNRPSEQLNDLGRDASILHFPEAVMPVIGFDWRCDSVDSFAAVRQSKEITQYSQDFRETIASVEDPLQLRATLLQRMREAMDWEAVAARAKATFETVGTTANIAGLFPVLGTLASLVNVHADMAQRAATRTESNSQWYLLGPKMREVALKDMLERGR
ncbi:MAG: hypothetical protein QM775_30170 [Pirellulales bacterium]